MTQYVGSVNGSLEDEGSFDDFLTFGEEGPSFKGVFYSRSNVDFKEDNPYEEMIEWRNKSLLEGEIDISDNVKWFMSLKVSYDFFQGEKRRYEYDVDVFEGYVDIYLENLDLHLGKQIVTWGSGDISIMDNVNPKNLEELFFIEMEFMKIPILIARANYYIEDFEVEVMLIPFYEPMKFAKEGTDWSIIQGDTLKNIEKGFEDLEVEGSRDMIGGQDFPDKNPKNCEFGLRVAGTKGGYDFSFSYLYVWEDFALLEFTPEFIDIAKKFPKGTIDILMDISIPEVIISYPIFTQVAHRQHIWGADVVTTYEGVGIQAEGMLLNNQHLYNTNLELIDRPIFMYSLGLDYNFPHDILAKIIFLETIIMNYDPSIFIDEVINFLGGGLRTSFIRERLTIGLGGLYDITYEDFAVLFSADYKYRDDVSFTGGINILEGDPDTIFGMYTDNDNISLGVKYSF